MRRKKTININKSKLFVLGLITIVVAASITTFAITYSDYTSATTLNEANSRTGINGNTVILDDALADWNYYMGLNYTESYDGILPDGQDQELYTPSNLVPVTITYSGIDINDNTKVGYVSTTERQNTYIYYKYIPANNGRITIELIDNPFTDRPTDQGFNGWVTNYNDTKISYDSNYYTRYASVPVTMENGVPSEINITFNASWYDAKVAYLSSNSVANAAASLDNEGMIEIGGADIIYEDISNLYISGSASFFGSYPSGAVSNNGSSLSGTCWSSNCPYYTRVGQAEYNPSAEYYQLINNAMTRYYPAQIAVESRFFPNTFNVAGFYKKINVGYNQQYSNYYDNNGNLVSGRCTSNSGCQYYELQNYYKNDNTENKATGTDYYYYLVTRDMNILVMNQNASGSVTGVTKPLTITGVHNGNNYNTTWTLNNGYFVCGNDTTVENIKISTNQASSTATPATSNRTNRNIYGNNYNLKIGRGITRNSNYRTVAGVFGGTNATGAEGSATNTIKYKLMVESGHYNSITQTNGGITGTRSKYVEGKAQYGNDYDRAANNNTNLDVYFDVSGSFGGEYYASTSNGITFDANVKSGTFGSYKTSGSGYDSAHTIGIYVGGRNSGTHHSARQIKVEGGFIYNLIGGPLTASDRRTVNDTYIYMTGGEVDMIIGGAGTSATYGNRIVSVTGGRVNYSVFGGSNSYDGSSTDGTLNGTSFVYIGGNAIIGNINYVENGTKLWGAEAGSVFGIGNGKSGTATIGSNDNSNVMIDGNATILNNVYGGGNYGATGAVSNNNTSTTNIYINGGTVKGSVYGGGNNNGAGSSTKTNTVTINMKKGTVEKSIYGGSKQLGTVYGNVNLNITGGSIITSVYGGGEGGFDNNTASGTFVTGNVNVQIGVQNSNSEEPRINTSVYGGSAFGSVNGDVNTNGPQNKNTNVTVYSGTIQNVFGGAEGNNTYTPKIFGDVEVNINGGTIQNVFGGNNLKGVPSKEVIVNINGGNTQNAYAGGNKAEVGAPKLYLNDGEVTNAFGGGNEAKVTTSNVVLRGSSCENIYGGSNMSGNVPTSNVVCESGEAVNVYGGNNQGGTTNITNVTINGGNITNAYGGGEETDVTSSTNITLNAKVKNLFGGSDSDGEVRESHVTINNGIAEKVFGGNNLGGTTITSNVNINNGVIGEIYGGGLEADTTTSNVNFISGTAESIFGGGSNAGVQTTNVNLGNGYARNVFGGSNTGGTVITSNIVNITNPQSISNSNLDVDMSFTNSTINNSGATNIESSETLTFKVTNNTGQTLTKWDLYIITSDAILDSNWSSATVEEVNHTFHINEQNQWYGTNTLNPGVNNEYSFNIHSYVPYEDFKIIGYIIKGYDANNVEYKKTTLTNLNADNIFGGNNFGGLTKSSNINLTSGEIGKVFGGGERATTENTNIIINGALIKDTVFGGGDKANIVNDAIVRISGNSTIEKDVYGGGNEANVNGNTIVTVNSPSTVERNIYGGGNAGDVLENTNVTINSVDVTGNVFGGGNNGRVNENTNVRITSSNIGESVYAGGNGKPAVVLGNTNLSIEGQTVVERHVFGGGNAATTGCGETNDPDEIVIENCQVEDNSKSYVNIAGGHIKGNVYGGANTSRLYGEAFVNIGIDKVDNSLNLIKSDINIEGTVFGGGEKNASGSEDYDFDYISVTKGITINIDGNSHNNFDISGSIFGSGNASSSGGYSYINIYNYGTPTDYKKNISIQRTDRVVISNSAIELSGATDRTNKYKTELFTLSRIKELKLKNNSTLYLDTGANLLEKYKSVKDENGSEVKETITIDKENKTVTKNVDNRIYMLEGKNLNISDDESLATYGIVDGMTFFGMFTKSREGRVTTALYSNEYDYGDTVSGSELYYFSSGSYVLGQHKTNHDYEVDGFYTNYPEEEGNTIRVDFIEPTPPDTNYYRWVVGESVEVLEVNLTASKYSTLGTFELQLLNFYEPNTEISVLGVNFDDLQSDINLLPQSDIPRHASTADDANSNFGLAMKTGTNGWITRGETEFISTGGRDVRGTTTYKSENSNTIPSFVFYLYHSKNLTLTKNLGSATISLMVATPIDDLNTRVQRINIQVNMNSALYDGDNYEAAITPGTQYQMFAPNIVNITSKSTFSTYFSLYSTNETSIYKPGYHRSLVSSYVLPVNTKITMIDFGSSDKPEYYYYVINNADYSNGLLEKQTEGEVSYTLSKFIRMGSSSTNNNFDDVEANAKYYDEDLDKAEEEFIFIIDLGETNIATDVLRESILLELRDVNDNPIIPVLDVEQSKMKYNLYADKDAVIEASATLSKNTLYVGSSVDLTVVTDFEQQRENNVNIIDTNFYDMRLGIKLSIFDENNHIVNGASLLGTKFIYNGRTYYPRQDGTVRFNIAESVANVSSRITIDTTDGNLASGTYKIVVETFASADGIYYGNTSSSKVEKQLIVVNDIFGLKADCKNEDVLVDKITGQSADKNNLIEYQVNYSSGLTNPNIRISLLRRTYTDVYIYDYELVDLADYVTNELTETSSNLEYLVSSTPSNIFNYILTTKENLVTGTYKVRFSLYDDNTKIGHIDKYIIIE